MKKFQKRLIKDHNQLAKKLNKLEEFMNDCERFCVLPEEQKDLIETQHSAMITYIKIIELRLNSMEIKLVDISDIMKSVMEEHVQKI